MTGLLVERSTPLVQLQDVGRFGSRHLGVTQGGAADWISMFWANALLGNPLDATVIEVTIGGLSLLAQQDTCLAIGGANLAARLDGEPIQPWRSFRVRQGQRLEFQSPVLGVRAYLAAPGGFDSPICLGSRSTVIRDGLGGLDGQGRAIESGSLLRFQGALPLPKVQTLQRPPNLGVNTPLQVVIGAQIADFSGQSLFDFFNESWQVDARADRMGIRILGPQLSYQGKGLISEGVPLGAIQVPPDGQPIILLNDRQTIGGYPRIGALTPVSAAHLAQAQPGARLKFTPVVQDTAQQEYLRVLEQLERFTREASYCSTD
ncbi:TPA: biotin-dependent carboxyltransferase [Pseudomonas aeruginosa]|nr:biotin-dependent carboxyltransferase [Pseudomonas aeruginosa]